MSAHKQPCKTISCLYESEYTNFIHTQIILNGDDDTYVQPRMIICLREVLMWCASDGCLSDHQYQVAKYID